MLAVVSFPATAPLGAFKETRLDPGLRIPRWLALWSGVVLALGPIAAMTRRRAPPAVRALRGILATSGASYVTMLLLDMNEHFRLEKELTGHRLRWKAVPLPESALHAGILASVFAALLSARRPRRTPRGRDRVMVLAPAAFLAIGWLDEIVYHRRRAPMREEIIHAVEHIAEGMMWTALYALRVLRKR